MKICNKAKECNVTQCLHRKEHSDYEVECDAEARKEYPMPETGCYYRPDQICINILNDRG